MNIRIKITVYAGLLLGLLYMLNNCGSGDKTKQQSPDNQPTSQVVDTLLEPAYILSTAGMSVQPPVGFTQVSDSFHQVMKAYFLKQSGADNIVHFQDFFINRQSGSGMVVFSIDSLNLSADTNTFFHKYGMSLLQLYGKGNVAVGGSQINDVFVKRFIVSDSVVMRNQLLCLAPDGNAMELHYVTPIKVSKMLSELIEHSISSIKTAKVE